MEKEGHPGVESRTTENIGQWRIHNTCICPERCQHCYGPMFASFFHYSPFQMGTLKAIFWLNSTHCILTMSGLGNL